MRKNILIILLFFFIGISCATAADFELQIESLIDVLQGHSVEINIFANKSESGISGFDLRVAFDRSALTLVDVKPGNFVVESEWDYFDYRIWPWGMLDENMPDGIVRIIGHNESSGASSGNPEKDTLAVMTFLVSNIYNHAGTLQPIQFYWTSCGDNQLISGDGDTIFISSSVTDHDSTIITKDTLLATYTGAPSFCLTGDSPDWGKTVFRSIDFINGKIDIIPVEVLDDRCDLNLNGIYFDIGDFLILIDYMLMGLWPLPPTVKACGDLNNDGIPLTIEDIVYGIRIIQGEALPVDEIGDPFDGVVEFTDCDDKLTIVSDFDKSVGGAYMEYYVRDTLFEVTMSPDLTDMTLLKKATNNILRILLLGFAKGAAIDTVETELLTISYSGQKPELIGINAAGYNGENVDITTQFIHNCPLTIAGDCGQMICVDGGVATANFYAIYDGDESDLFWSVFSVNPRPFGNYTFKNGVLNFYPDVQDSGKVFEFTVHVFDDAGAYDLCTVFFIMDGVEPFEFKIESLYDQEPGTHAYLPVIKTKGSERIFGFDFLLGYDNSVLTFLSAIGGEPFANDGEYQWEYFTYRYTFDSDCDGSCPSGLMRFVGIADENDGPHHALNFNIPDRMILFTIDFLISGGVGNIGFHPVRFYWKDCGDNTIAFRYDDDYDFVFRTATSDTIVDYNGDLINNPEFGFPGYYGAPDSCVFDSVHDKVNPRFINFRNGGVEIPPEEIDNRGDVNLNGRRYEIADCVVFANYFIYGEAAFTIDKPMQINACDMDNDGTLSLTDLVYLARIVTGDVPAIMPDSTGTYAIFSHNRGMINVDVDLGAAYFVFEGDITVSPGIDINDMTTISNYRDGKSYTLIFGYDRGATCTGNILNAADSFLTVEAVDYYGNAYKIREPDLAFRLSNFPNPFGQTTDIRFVLPNATDWQIEIFNVLGQQVRYIKGSNPAGEVLVPWHRTDDNNHKLPTGVYFYRLQAGDMSTAKKMILLR